MTVGVAAPPEYTTTPTYARGRSIVAMKSKRVFTKGDAVAIAHSEGRAVDLLASGWVEKNPAPKSSDAPKPSEPKK